MNRETTDRLYDLGTSAHRNVAAAMTDLGAVLDICQREKGLNGTRPAVPPVVSLILVVGISLLLGGNSPEKAMRSATPPGVDFALGNRSMQARDWDRAILHFQTAHSHGGDPAKVLPRLAEAQYYANKKRDAVLTCDTLDSLVEGNPHGAYIRGLVLLDDGKKAEAAKEFDEALRCGLPAARIMLKECK
jgi:tetratricopeptide (TPR) repeat protein